MISSPSIVPALLELERLFHFFNQELWEGKLRCPVITLQNLPSSTIGFYSENAVQCGQKHIDEIAVTFEAVGQGVQCLVEVLLHEMVHLSNSQQGINDCTNRQYHNKSFRCEAERVGLVVAERKGFGFCITALGPVLKRLLKKAKVDKTAFNFARNPKALRTRDGRGG